MNRKPSRSKNKHFHNLQQLRALHTLEDVALLLSSSAERLEQLLYVQTDEERYKIFKLPKRRRTGEYREIAVPNEELMQVQRRLSILLRSMYRVRNAIHGFVRGRSIVSNASNHVGRSQIVNIDIKDFFPSITFQRVRDLFMNPPYYIDETVATIIAHICCFRNGTQSIPQGAPTSPILSNMICRRMDGEIIHLMQNLNGGEDRYLYWYTRYADDMTISTATVMMPPEIAILQFSRDGEATVKVGGALQDIIRGNGFEINMEKVRISRQKERQEVTGLIVNQKLNVNKKLINQIRAMLNAWENYGYEQAQAEFFARHDRKARNPAKQERKYSQIVRGKIEFLKMVRGEDDKTYTRFLVHYLRLSGTSTRLINQAVAMMDAWEKHGYEQVQAEFSARSRRNFHSSGEEGPTYSQSIARKIEVLRMVRGEDDKIYLQLLERFRRLSEPER